MKTTRLLSFLSVFLSLAGAVCAQFGIVTTSYHGVTTTTHQSQFNSLSSQGYRMISLAVAGTRQNPRYSAVWQQVGGPAWGAVHGLTYTQYQQQAAAWTISGYRAKLVAASGAPNDPVFAAMWVADGVTVGYAQAVLAADFDATCNSQRNQGRRLVSCARYTYNNVERCAMVFEPDPSGIAWGASTSDDATAFSHKFNEFSLGHARPTLISTTETQRYTHVWRDDRVGQWVAVAGRTSSQFSADKVNYSNQGLTLTNIAASGIGSSAIYAGIFQERLVPYSRSLTRTGQAVPAMSTFDTYVQSLMQNEGVRNASLAVARHGRLIYARGYTYAEPGQFTTQPTTPFRLGSISKALCGTVVQDLISRGQGNLSYSTSLVNYLGITPYAAGAQNATVIRLLRHMSGMTNNIVESAARQWWIQQTQQTLLFMPLDENIIVRYACTKPFGPTTSWSYSNPGNTALGQIIEQATGQQYMTALRSRLFAPVGTLDLWQQRPRPQNAAPGEAPYFLPAVTLEASNIYSDYRLLSNQYAREYWDSAGGAVSSAMVLARVVSGAFCIGDDSPSLLPAARQACLNRGTSAHHITDGSWYWGNLGNGRYRYEHAGAVDGFGATCTFTSDGLCIVLLTNMSEVTGNATSLVNLADGISQWPTHDLFPNYGMPTFPRTPQLQVANPTSVPNVGDTPWVIEGEGLDQVTSVIVGSNTITSQSPNTWHSGWFVRESPTRLRVHPPQGQSPGLVMVRAVSAQGQGNSLFLTLTRTQQFVCKANDTVQNGQPFAAYVSRGPHPDLSLAFLTLSGDQLPSVAPGIVSLGIGNMFQSLTISDARQFASVTGAVRWDFPSIVGMPRVHLQAVLFNPFLPNPFQLPATAVETVVRVP